MRSFKLAIAAFSLGLSAPVAAQQYPAETAAAATRAGDADGGNPRLGLLGLLGLIGLLGFFRREPNIHVDARRQSAGVSEDSNARS